MFNDAISEIKISKVIKDKIITSFFTTPELFEQAAAPVYQAILTQMALNSISHLGIDAIAAVQNFCERYAGMAPRTALAINDRCTRLQYFYYVEGFEGKDGYEIEVHTKGVYIVSQLYAARGVQSHKVLYTGDC